MRVENKSRRDLSIDGVKFATLWLVVFGHVLVFYDIETPSLFNMVETPVYLVDKLVQVIYSFHMPLFFILAGMVYRPKDFCLKFIYIKIKRLLLPALLVFICFMIPVLKFLGYYEPLTWKNFVFNDGLRHIWYAHTLFCIFVLNRILDELKIPVVVKLLAAAVAFFSHPAFPIHGLTGNIIYFQIGEVFGKKFNCSPGVWLMAGGIFLLVLNFGTLHLTGQMGQDLYDLTLALTGSLFFFNIAKHLKYHFHEQLGVYLLHPMLIYLFQSVLKDKNLEAWPWIISVTIISFFMAMILTKLYHKAISLAFMS